MCKSRSKPVPDSTLAVLYMLTIHSRDRQISTVRLNRFRGFECLNMLRQMFQSFVCLFLLFFFFFAFSFFFFSFFFLSASSRYPNGRGFEGISLPGSCYKGINFKIDTHYLIVPLPRTGYFRSPPLRV